MNTQRSVSPARYWARLAAVVVLGALLATPEAGKAAESCDIPGLWSAGARQLTDGNVSEAERTFRAALLSSPTDAQRAGSALRLAVALTATGRTELAAEQLAVARSLAGALDEDGRRELAQAEGMLAARQGDFAAAERSFTAAAANASGVPAAEAQATINALRARMDRRDIAGLEDRLADANQLVSQLPAGDPAARLSIALGDLYRRAVNEFRSPVALRRAAFDNFARATQMATTPATRAEAYGSAGALYEDEGRSAEALRLTAQAIFMAQSVDARDQLYRWEWQAGRIQKQSGDTAASVASLDRAVTILDTVRNDVLVGSRGAYTQLVEPVYLEYADMQLRQAAALPEASTQQQQLLRSVRNQLESLKQAEVQDYFENACVTAQDPDSNGAFNVPGAAVVYPILLADRIEVLIETRGVLRRFSAPISQGQATVTARDLRRGLESATSGNAFLAPAQTLYRWLLADAEPWLAENGVDTLVFVPSGALRTIPVGALHDGQRFLIERYALATTPAISLVDATASAMVERVLVGGITESVQGFSELPSVAQEMKTVSSFFPTESLQDETFLLSSVESQLATTGYSIAHLATHGEFSADYRQSFVLTYDNRLTMDKLKDALGRRGAPLDLLVLSACQTAAGDDRAALGLAGVAVQAGAKSALASLWYISDEATAALMAKFYMGYGTAGTTKARSLRDAQLELLKTEQFRHPSYWAPYLLIGNWL